MLVARRPLSRATVARGAPPVKVRVSPSELAATLEGTARTFNFPPGRLATDRRDAGLCLVDTKTGRELCGYRLTTREMDAALTIAAALADISPAIVQPTARPFAVQEGAIFLSAEQVQAIRATLGMAELLPHTPEDFAAINAARAALGMSAL
jgi:hypothetical protein